MTAGAMLDRRKFWGVRHDPEIDEWEVHDGHGDTWALCEMKSRADRLCRMLNATRPSEVEPEHALNKCAEALEEIIRRCKELPGNRDLVRLCRNALKFVAPSRSTTRNRKRRRGGDA